MADATEDCDDDDIAVLMPNVMKLLHAEIDAEGSEGSTSMSISSEGEKEDHLVQNERPINTHEATSKGQPQRETLIQEVAKRFRREGASGRGCLSLSKPLDLAPFRCHASPRGPGTSHFPFNSIPNKNKMVTAPVATKRGTRLTLEEKMAMKARPQPKTSKDLAQGTLRTKLKLKHSLAANSKTRAGRTTLSKITLSGHGQGHDKHGHVQSLAGARPRRRAKICSKPTPVDLSELRKTFAQLDEEPLEEEQESSVHVRLQYSTVVTQMPAHDAKVNGEEETCGKFRSGIRENLKESSEHTQNKAIELQAQLLREPQISSGKATLRKTDGDASRTPPRTCSEERPVLEESNSNTNPDSKTENGSEEHQSRPNHVDVLQPEGEQTLHEYSGKSREVGVSENIEILLHHKIAGVGPNSEKRTYFRDSAGLVITCEEVSLSQCSGKTGAPKLQVTTTSKIESPPALLPQPLAGQCGMASDKEPLLKDQSRRESVNRNPQKRASLSEAENLSATKNPPERTCSTPSPQTFDHGPSASGNEDPGSKKRHPNACELGNSGRDSAPPKDTQYIHYCQPSQKNHPPEESIAVSNIQEGTYDVDMESSSSPPLKPVSNLGRRYSTRGKSIETSQRRLAFVSDSSASDKEDGLKNIPVQGSGSKFASDQQAEERLSNLVHSLIDQDENCRVDINNPAQVSGENCDTVEGPGCNMANASLDDMSCPGNQWNDTLPPIEEQNPLVADVVHEKENCDSRLADDRRKGNRQKRGKTVNLGSPIDAGTRWSEGRRMSTRIKSKPLDWWRGEKMMYGRVHSALCTLIGIKTMSPDPIWPKPKPNRGDNKVHKFYIDSFVDDKYTDLLRLAAQ